jgi:hypothetical protein
MDCTMTAAVPWLVTRMRSGLEVQLIVNANWSMVTAGVAVAVGVSVGVAAGVSVGVSVGDSVGVSTVADGDASVDGVASAELVEDGEASAPTGVASSAALTSAAGEPLSVGVAS